ncbi:MAG: hypothetical protein LW629_01020 [Burkholderiales bacterium]|jgi:hypothetical protein|nr:hypothetical protein [Burkholderiales bacterium]
MALSQALLQDLLLIAIQLSQLPAVDVSQIPDVQLVSPTVLMEKVCPDEPARCRNMAAVFDTEAYQIYVRAPFSEQNAMDKSFLIHELVHVLQFKLGGHERFGSCEAVLANERQAYQVQNLYLHQEGSDWREGFSLRFMTCPTTAK